MPARGGTWNGSKWISAQTRLRVYARDHFRCVYCDACHDLSLDHLVPVTRGGDNSPTNLLTACRSCNNKRQHKYVTRFAPARVRKIYATAKRKLPLLRNVVVPKHLRARFLKVLET